MESSSFLILLNRGKTKNGTTCQFNNVTGRFCSKANHGSPHRLWVSYKQLNPLADGLSADGAGLERGAALDAGGVSTLEDQFDVVVDADGAGDSLLHLPVSRLQLLQQVVLL